MGVSKNNGTPKWMVKIMENPVKIDDLGGNTPIFGNTHIALCLLFIWTLDFLQLFVGHLNLCHL